MKEKYLFRLVPTMRCNFQCDYCFLSDNEKRPRETMFDQHDVNEWIDAMQLYSDKEIEIYMWGGEPFILNDVYTLLREWLSMDHISTGCRIDTNVFFAEKIARECPSNKLKLNCSYHMQYHTLDEQFRKVEILKKLDMVGMMNFVASETNLKHMQQDYHMTVFDLIEKFAEIDVHVNIAGDFAITSHKEHPRYDEYMKFILQFISLEEWMALRGGGLPCRCSAAMKYFTVNYNGNLTSCLKDNCTYGNLKDGYSYGNFFKGTVFPEKEPQICKRFCTSLISYPFREDNDFRTWNSLVEYANRSIEYRMGNKKGVNYEI